MVITFDCLKDNVSVVIFESFSAIIHV
jgi:hypothetical protein